MGSLFIQYRLIFHSSSVWCVNTRAIPQLQFEFQIVSCPSVQLPHVSTLVYSTISSTDLIYWANISNCRRLTTNTGMENSGRTVVVFGCQKTSTIQLVLPRGPFVLACNDCNKKSPLLLLCPNQQCSERQMFILLPEVAIYKLITNNQDQRRYDRFSYFFH